MAEREMRGRPRVDFNLAYVMTHYPRVALTFIAGEVDEIEWRGGRIFPIVMEAPAPADLSNEEARDRGRRSLYLKSSPLRIAEAMLATPAAHPLKMARLVVTAT